MGGNRERMRDIFDQARRLPKAERAAFLNGLAAVDGTMRAQVEDMLAALDEAGPFLSEPTQGHIDASPTADSAAAATLVAPLREGPGTRIGPYKLLQLIGEGGFGSVFMAEQERPVSRKVALKIIKLGMDTRQVVARFEQERQALAILDHPNIAKVFDAGATETGRPYFVMELVKGDPIVEYCDKNNLSIEDRLELFAQVCNAVQHAHTKGIIHRDIKPSNILVSTQDGRPHTKVIDFGIAKATMSKLTEKTLFTEHRQLIGTPEYMSPEQAEGSLDIDTRTDVYSLGVLLYELLTGTTPFTGKELRSAAFGELQRIIREVEPPKPSTRISQNTDTIASIATKRHTEPKRLGTIVRGELDWIVMKALEKDRQRRYETANGLAMDIKRYLSGEAVVAAPPSTSYRFKKFVKRNRVMVSAGSAVAAALLVGVVAFAWQFKVASDQRDIAVQAEKAEAEQRKAAEAERAEAVAQQTEAEKQEAEAKKQEAEAKKQAAIAEAVATFQTDMLAAVDPTNLPKDPVTGQPLKDAVTVVQAIEAAVKKLDEGSLKDQPLVEASVRATIGSTLGHLSRDAAAETNLRKALELHRAILPPDHVEIAESMRILGAFVLSRNRIAEAEPLIREAEKMYREVLPAGHQDHAKGLNNLALLLMYQIKYAEAEGVLREALAIRRATLPAGHSETINHLHNLAMCLQKLNKPAEAEQIYREAVSIYRAMPTQPVGMANTLSNFGAFLVSQNRLSEAEPLIREALAIDRDAYTDGHPNLEGSITSLALLLQGQNKLAEAEPHFREALAILRANFPAGGPNIALAMTNLGDLLRGRDKTAEAELLIREAVAIFRQAPSDWNGGLARSLSSLALLLQDQNKLAEAETALQQALVVYRQIYPKGHPFIAFTAKGLADLYAMQGKTDEAVRLLREVVESSRARLPQDSLELGTQLAEVSMTLLKLNAWEEAEPTFREVLAIRRAALPAGHPDIATTLSNLARVQQAVGQTAEARAGWDESIPMLRKNSPNGSALLARVLWRSGSARLENKDATAALPELEEAVTMAEKFLKPEDKQLKEYRETLASCKAAMAK